MLHLGLILAHNLLNTTLPENIKQTVEKDRTARLLATQVSDRLFKSSDLKFNKYLFLLRCRNSNRDKFTYLSNITFAPNEKDWNFLQLPKYFHFLYYIIRPYRLLIEYLFESNSQEEKFL